MPARMTRPSDGSRSSRTTSGAARMPPSPIPAKQIAVALGASAQDVAGQQDELDRVEAVDERRSDAVGDEHGCRRRSPMALIPTSICRPTPRLPPSVTSTGVLRAGSATTQQRRDDEVRRSARSPPGAGRAEARARRAPGRRSPPGCRRCCARRWPRRGRVRRTSCGVSAAAAGSYIVPIVADTAVVRIASDHRGVQRDHRRRGAPSSRRR